MSPTGEHQVPDVAMPERPSQSPLILAVLVVSLIGGIGGLCTGVGTYYVLSYRVDQLEKQVAVDQTEHAAQTSASAADHTAMALFAQKLDTVAGDVRDIKRAMRLSPRTARDDGP